MRGLALVVIAAGPLIAAAAEPPALQHNPFLRPALGAPVDADPESRAPQRLRATLVNGTRSLANIDGTLVGVGDRIGDATVTAIREGVVTLLRDTTSYTLTLIENKDNERDEN